MSEIKPPKSFSLHAPTEEERAELAREVRDAYHPTTIRFSHAVRAEQTVPIPTKGWVIDPSGAGSEYVTLRKTIGPIRSEQEIPRCLDRDRCDALRKLLEQELANPETKEVVLYFHDPLP